MLDDDTLKSLNLKQLNSLESLDMKDIKPKCNSHRSTVDCDSVSTTHTQKSIQQKSNLKNDDSIMAGDDFVNNNKTISRSQQFLCAFHNKEISVKHTSKNKFYCVDCNVKSEYVTD